MNTGASVPALIFNSRRPAVELVCSGARRCLFCLRQHALQRFPHLLLLAIAAASFGGPSTSLGGCQEYPDQHYKQCDLLTEAQNGQKPMVVPVKANWQLHLVNTSGGPLQINQVAAQTGEQNYWSEFCAHLDDFSCTCEPVPGKGEVGCTFKRPGENYPPLQWDGIETMLAVPAGSTVYLDAHTPAVAPGHSIAHTYVISAYPQYRGILSYRFPTADKQGAQNQCNGTTQVTNGPPIQNTSGRPWYVGGATVYAVGGGANSQTSVAAACVYILDTSGQKIIYKYCNHGLNVRGHMDLPGNPVVNNGEYLFLQASNDCAAGNIWGYHGWLYVSYVSY